MSQKSRYILQHLEEDSTYTVSFDSVSVDEIINTCIQFLHGCGFSEPAVYSYMSEISEMYFDSIENDLINLIKGSKDKEEMTISFVDSSDYKEESKETN